MHHTQPLFGVEYIGKLAYISSEPCRVIGASVLLLSLTPVTIKLSSNTTLIVINSALMTSYQRCNNLGTLINPLRTLLHQIPDLSQQLHQHGCLSYRLRRTCWRMFHIMRLSALLGDAFISPVTSGGTIGYQSIDSLPAVRQRSLVPYTRCAGKGSPGSVLRCNASKERNTDRGSGPFLVKDEPICEEPF